MSVFRSDFSRPEDPGKMPVPLRNARVLLTGDMRGEKGSGAADSVVSHGDAYFEESACVHLDRAAKKKTEHLGSSFDPLKCMILV